MDGTPGSGLAVSDQTAGPGEHQGGLPDACEAIDGWRAVAEAVTELPEQEQLHYVQASTAAALTDAQYAAVQWAAMVMNLTNRISILSHHPVRRRED